VTDWELYERLLDHGFQKALGVDPKHHPVLLAEPTYNTRQLRERATELLFEKYQVPALFTAKNPVLSTYAAHRHLHSYFFFVSRSARSVCVLTRRAPIVSDSRRAEAQRSSWTRAALLRQPCRCTTAMPSPNVHPALWPVLFRTTDTTPHTRICTGLSRSGVAGDTLTKELFKYLEKKGTTVRPQYCIERKVLPSGGFQISELDFPNITQSYHNHMALVLSLSTSFLRHRRHHLPFNLDRVSCVVRVCVCVRVRVRVRVRVLSQMQEVVRDIKESILRLSEIPFDEECAPHLAPGILP
jgi:hypothetical protein